MAWPATWRPSRNQPVGGLPQMPQPFPLIVASDLKSWRAHRGGVTSRSNWHRCPEDKNCAGPRSTAAGTGSEPCRMASWRAALLRTLPTGSGRRGIRFGGAALPIADPPCLGLLQAGRRQGRARRADGVPQAMWHRLLARGSARPLVASHARTPRSRISGSVAAAQGDPAMAEGRRRCGGESPLSPLCAGSMGASAGGAAGAHVRGGSRDASCACVCVHMCTQVHPYPVWLRAVAAGRP